MYVCMYVCMWVKISGIALQLAIQNWPSFYASLKCRATSCDAFLTCFKLIYN